MASKFLSGAKRAREIFDALANEVVFTGVNSRGNITVSRKQGQNLALKTKTAYIVIGTDATISTVTATASAWIPAGSMIMGFVGRVTSTLTGATANVSVGYTGVIGAFSNAKASMLATGTTFAMYADGSSTAPIIRGANTDLLFTSSSGTWTGGTILITMFYYTLTAPTSAS